MFLRKILVIVFMHLSIFFLCQIDCHVQPLQGPVVLLRSIVHVVLVPVCREQLALLQDRHEIFHISICSSGVATWVLGQKDCPGEAVWVLEEEEKGPRES